MTIWRLELLRLFRTFRWAGLAASYLVFGILGPVITRYQEALFRNVGGDIKMIVPPPSAPQAIASYVGNASQIGLLVTIFIAAGSLAFDARPEWAAFLRTRASSIGGIVLPKFAVNAAAAATSFAVGAVAAWLLTSVLIDDVPVGAMLAGIVLWAVYLAFAVSVVALAAGLSRSVIGAAGITAVVLLVMPLGAEVLGVAKPWMPSTLVGSLTAMVAGGSATEYLRAVGVAALATAACLLAAERLLRRREL
jgi:ABC-2 type transport system permease protein